MLTFCSDTPKKLGIRSDRLKVLKSLAALYFTDLLSISLLQVGSTRRILDELRAVRFFERTKKLFRKFVWWRLLTDFKTNLSRRRILVLCDDVCCRHHCAASRSDRWRPFCRCSRFGRGAFACCSRLPAFLSPYFFLWFVSADPDSPSSFSGHCFAFSLFRGESASLYFQ